MVPESTYKRRKRLNLTESERSERLARVIAIAEHTWGIADAAHDWLNSPHHFLDGQSPVEMARTEVGARAITFLSHPRRRSSRQQ